MKTRLCFLLFACIVLMACEKKDLEKSLLLQGRVVGVINCVDNGKTTKRTGYYIITSKSDYLLSFYCDIEGHNYGGDWGRYGIPDYIIPFKFTFELLDPIDDDYVKYIDPVSNALYPGLGYPVEHFKQARLITIN